MCRLFLIYWSLHRTPMLNTVVEKMRMQSVLYCVESPCDEPYRRALIA